MWKIFKNGVDKRLKEDKMIRDTFEESVHCTVLLKRKIHERWMFRKHLNEEKNGICNCKA